MRMPHHHPKCPAAGLLRFRRGQRIERQRDLERQRLSLCGQTPHVDPRPRRRAP